jgi:hypothetical protein
LHLRRTDRDFEGVEAEAAVGLGGEAGAEDGERLKVQPQPADVWNANTTTSTTTTLPFHRSRFPTNKAEPIFYPRGCRPSVQPVDVWNANTKSCPFKEVGFSLTNPGIGVT